MVICDIVTNEVLKTKYTFRFIHDNMLCVVDSDNSYFIDLNGRIIKEFKNIILWSVSDDGIAIGSFNGKLYIYNINLGRGMIHEELNITILGQILISKDSTLIMIGSEDGLYFLTPIN